MYLPPKPEFFRTARDADRWLPQYSIVEAGPRRTAVKVVKFIVGLVIGFLIGSVVLSP